VIDYGLSFAIFFLIDVRDVQFFLRNEKTYTFGKVFMLSNISDNVVYLFSPNCLKFLQLVTNFLMRQIPVLQIWE